MATIPGTPRHRVSTKGLKTEPKLSFIEVDYQEPHRGRARAIQKAHPEVKALFGRNLHSMWILFGVVSVQIATAAFIAQQSWWVILLVAWGVGAFANHALWVLIHECTHNLILKGRAGNRLLAILANLPFGIPAAISFSIYHIKHHQHQGEYELDADLAGTQEASLIGNRAWGKALWEFFFPLFQSIRTTRFTKSGAISFFDRWVLLNVVIQFAFDAALVWFFGCPALGYLFASLCFSIGFHPLGARWIQEHFVVHEQQETYSYYGPLNRVALNVGFHNEHHDFPRVAWNRLPAVKRLAPEYYESLYAHQSWTRLWLRFLLDPKLSLFSRVTRKDQKGAPPPLNQSPT